MRLPPAARRLSEIREKLARADVAAFETQGRFIESRYKDETMARIQSLARSISPIMISELGAGRERGSVRRVLATAPLRRAPSVRRAASSGSCPRRRLPW